ncbi:19937_t:CDS:2 [Entrophospora sp. SA101]|nr:19937_t:CDS:2 [Entrophospora sp. SA101]
MEEDDEEDDSALQSTDPKSNTKIIEVGENTNNFLYHYSKITHAESKSEIANGEVIECYFNFGAERAGKIYDLFVSIGKEKIRGIKTFSASTISNLSQDNIDYVIVKILAQKAVA